MPPFADLIVLEQIAGGIELKLHLPGHFRLVEERRKLAQFFFACSRINRAIDVMLCQGLAVAIDLRNPLASPMTKFLKSGNLPPPPRLVPSNVQRIGFATIACPTRVPANPPGPAPA